MLSHLSHLLLALQLSLLGLLHRLLPGLVLIAVRIRLELRARLILLPGLELLLLPGLDLRAALPGLILAAILAGVLAGLIRLILRLVALPRLVFLIGLPRLILLIALPRLLLVLLALDRRMLPTGLCLGGACCCEDECRRW